MTNLNPYEVLGVQRDADEKTVRKAYRDKAKTAHPDQGGDADEFAKVTTSLAVLTDPEKRKRFDETGRIDEDNPNNIRAAALQVISGEMAVVMNLYVNSGYAAINDPTRTDVPKRLIRQIKAQIRDADGSIGNGKTFVTFLENMKRRMKPKKPAEGDEADPIGRDLDRQIHQAEQQMAGLDTAIKCRELAITILEGYEFEVAGGKAYG